MKESLLILIFYLSVFSCTRETDQFNLALSRITNYLRMILRERSIPIGVRVYFVMNIYRKAIVMIHTAKQALLNKKQDEDKMREEQRKAKEDAFNKKMAKILSLKKHKSKVFLRF